MTPTPLSDVREVWLHLAWRAVTSEERRWCLRMHAAVTPVRQMEFAL